LNRKEVQSYLIKRFIIIIAITSVAEYLLLTLLNRNVLPLIMRIYFGNNYMEGRVSALTIVAAILLTILTLIVKFFAFILPSPLSGGVTSVAELLTSLMQLMFSAGGSGSGSPNVSSINQIVFLMMLVAYVVLIALPYVISGFIFVRVVISKMKEIEEEERSRNREYERKRNLMISDIAHDIRTPVTTISGYSQAIMAGKVRDEELDDYLEAIRNKSGRLTELVGLLFDYVRLDSEGFEMDRKPLDICETVRECIAFVYDDIEKKEMEIDIDVPEEPVMVSADKIHISRAVTNLITNAVKHNESGTKIGLSVIPLEKQVKISVADNGNEIPAELAENLFDPFVMGEKSRTTRSGSGLGLSIVKKTVEMHEGTIELVSPFEGGYTKAFVITLQRQDKE